MQANAPTQPQPVGWQNDLQQQQQQPALPSYAEAMRTTGPPNFSQPPYPVDQAAHHPTAPVYGTQAVPLHPQYNQANYAPGPLPTYTTNAYPQYGQTAVELDGPTTIHIIRPVPTAPNNCCSGRRGMILGIVLGLVILGTILRVTYNPYR